jgi:hypothetical protein
VDELSVVLKARELINKVSPTIIPVPIEAYVEHVGAVLRPRHDLVVPCRSASARVVPVTGRKKRKPISGSTIGIAAGFCLRTPVTSSSGTKQWRCYGSRMNKCRRRSGNAAKSKKNWG